jgi:hypothetical protein
MRNCNCREYFDRDGTLISFLKITENSLKEFEHFLIHIFHKFRQQKFIAFNRRSSESFFLAIKIGKWNIIFALNDMNS